MRFLAAIVFALPAAGLVILNEYRWRTKDNRHASFRTVVISVLILLGLSVVCHARPSPYPGKVTSFVGDRYGSAQLGPDVVRDVQRQRAGRKLNKRATAAQRKRPPVSRKRWRDVPIPAPRPGTVEPLAGDAAPLSVAGGTRREAAQVIGGRPDGCPPRFCGCALAIKIFGRIVSNLNLAINWRHVFPRTEPRPGMVAVRSGHVFQLMDHRAGNIWRVWDANSGRGRIRIHDRSIAGHAIVDPHAGRVAEISARRRN